jgi:hypothetical protein
MKSSEVAPFLRATSVAPVLVAVDLEAARLAT